MVTLEQIKQGAARYVDISIHAPRAGARRYRYTIRRYSLEISIHAPRAGASLSAIREHPAMKALGVFDEAGNVDIDKIYACLKNEAAKGPVTTNIPLIGNVTLNEGDVDKLYTLIKQS